MSQPAEETFSALRISASKVYFLKNEADRVHDNYHIISNDLILSKTHWGHHFDHKS